MQTFVRIAGLLTDYWSWGFQNTKETQPLGKDFRTNDFFKVNWCPCVSSKHWGRGYTNPLILNLGNDRHEWSASRRSLFPSMVPAEQKDVRLIAGLDLWKRKKISTASGNRNMIFCSPEASLVTTTILSSILSAELRNT